MASSQCILHTVAGPGQGRAAEDAAPDKPGAIMDGLVRRREGLVSSFLQLGPLRALDDADGSENLGSVSVKTVGPLIEGQSCNRAELIRGICARLGAAQCNQNAVENLIYKEAQRKSYAPASELGASVNVLEDRNSRLLWRWEVKKLSCLGDSKDAAHGVRAWCKQVQRWLSAAAAAQDAFASEGKAGRKVVGLLQKVDKVELPAAPPTYDRTCMQGVQCAGTQPPGVMPKMLPKVMAATSDAALVEKQQEWLAQKANKHAASLGFKDNTSLQKSRGLLATFVKAAAPAASSPEPPPPAPGPSQEYLQRLRDAVFAPQCRLDRAAELAGHRARWKAAGERLESSRVPGLPPPFSRRRGAPRDAEEIARRALGAAADWREAPRWRRKLLHFPADPGTRPPFYGSFSSKGLAVAPRRPFAQEALLDYSCCSDEEWEAEPEGDDVAALEDSDDDLDSADENDAGFVVQDGYVSEADASTDGEDDCEEGLRSPRAAGKGSGCEAAAAVGSLQALPGNVGGLVAAVLKARQAGNPFLLQRDAPPPGGGQASKVPRLDPQLLQALRTIPLVATAAQEPPAPSKPDSLDAHPGAPAGRERGQASLLATPGIRRSLQGEAATPSASLQPHTPPSAHTSPAGPAEAPARRRNSTTSPEPRGSGSGQEHQPDAACPPSRPLERPSESLSCTQLPHSVPHVSSRASSGHSPRMAGIVSRAADLALPCAEAARLSRAGAESAPPSPAAECEGGVAAASAPPMAAMANETDTAAESASSPAAFASGTCAEAPAPTRASAPAFKRSACHASEELRTDDRGSMAAAEPSAVKKMKVATSPCPPGSVHVQSTPDSVCHRTSSCMQ